MSINHYRRSILPAIAVIGFSSSAIQIVLIRELLIVFSGNELSIGIILANWLLFAAAGSYLASILADRFTRAWKAFAVLQVLFSLVSLMALLGARVIAGGFGLPMGETLDLPQTIIASLLIVSPVAAIGGCAFSFASKILGEVSRPGAPSSGRIFAFEALGSALGGLTLTFLLIPYLNAVRISMLLLVLNISSVIYLTVSSQEGRSGQAKEAHDITSSGKNILQLAIISMLALFLLSVLFPLADELQEKTIKWQWAGHDLKSSQNSVYGNVAVTQEEDQYTFYLDGYPFFTAPASDTAFMEGLVHMAMLYHPFPGRVLIIGGGIGGVLNEVQKYGPERVDYVEPDPLIIEMAKEYPTLLTESELQSPNVSIKYTDGRQFLAVTEKKYDVIIVNLPPPSSLLLNRFFTAEFYAKARQALTGNGIFVTVIPGSAVYLSDAQASLNCCIYRTLQDTFPYVRPIPGDYNVYVASMSPEMANLSPAVSASRFNNRNIDTQFVTDQYIIDRLSQEKLDWFNSSVVRGQTVSANRDFAPTAVLYDLWILNTRLSLQLDGFFRLIKDLNLLVFVIPLVAIFSLLLVARKRMDLSGRLAISVAVLATGFSSMVFVVVLTIALQSTYGYVYYIIGLLTAAFMAGLAAGSIVGVKAIENAAKRTPLLWKTELAILSFCVAMPLALAIFSTLASQSALLVAIFILCVLNGVLAGIEFPIANRMYRRDVEWSIKTPGTLYALDLLGACLGALIVSIYLIPVLGIWQTCFLIICLKLASFVLILLHRL